MQYQYYDLKNVEKGKIVEVTLKYAANVKLMDSSNYSNYKNGRKYRYYGGYVKKSPFQIPVPRSAHWYVVLDLGGYSGKISSSVRVLPGLAPAVRSTFSEPFNSLVLNDDTPKDYDVFISHASEDKELVVRPLANALREKGLKTWYDEFELKIGDDLKTKIDIGLKNSRFGIVVLSRHSLKKEWASYELEEIINRSDAGEQVLLPIWHNITKQEVMDINPKLIDKLARNTAINTIEEIATEIADVILNGGN